ncbi:hypothetical protein SCA6_018391 [Theobroma cacao]
MVPKTFSAKTNNLIGLRVPKLSGLLDSHFILLNTYPLLIFSQVLSSSFFQALELGNFLRRLTDHRLGSSSPQLQ